MLTFDPLEPGAPASPCEPCHEYKNIEVAKSHGVRDTLKKRKAKHYKHKIGKNIKQALFMGSVQIHH